MPPSRKPGNAFEVPSGTRATSTRRDGSPSTSRRPTCARPARRSTWRSPSGSLRSFCIKDHRNFPKDEDCGPGLGEIDHYKLLHAVAFTGRPMPLCCENIFAPLVPRPKDPEGVDVMARRAREFLDTVIQGLQGQENQR